MKASAVHVTLLFKYFLRHSFIFYPGTYLNFSMLLSLHISNIYFKTELNFIALLYHMLFTLTLFAFLIEFIYF